MPAMIGRIVFFVRRRQPAKRIGEPNLPALVSMSREHAFHEDRRAAAPHAGLHQIALYSLAQCRLDAELQAVESLEPNHGVGARRPILAANAQLLNLFE